MLAISDLEEQVGFSAVKIFENQMIHISRGKTNNTQPAIPIVMIKLKLYDVEIVTSNATFIDFFEHAVVDVNTMSLVNINKIIDRSMRMIIKQKKLIDVLDDIRNTGYENGQQDYAQYVSRSLTDLLDGNIN